MNKLILTTLTTLICTSVQSTTQYPELTNNYDNVWRADINELSKDFTYIDDDPYSMYLKDTGRKYNTPVTKPNDLKSLIIKPPNRFVNAANYLDADVIKKTGYVQDGDYMVFYILKSEVDKAVKRNGLQCIYKTKIRSDFGGISDHDLDSLENSYTNHMTKAGYSVSTFSKTSNQLGTLKVKNGYTSGTLFLIVNNKLITLIIHDCNKRGDSQIVKDLYEWSELLIEANK